MLNNDVSFDVDAGMNRTTSSGLCQSHECHHRIALLTASCIILNRGCDRGGRGRIETRHSSSPREYVETWKTYDETNFAKSADVTHFIDFGEASKDITDVLRQNELYGA